MCIKVRNRNRPGRHFGARKLFNISQKLRWEKYALGAFFAKSKDSNNLKFA